MIETERRRTLHFQPVFVCMEVAATCCDLLLNPDTDSVPFPQVIATEPSETLCIKPVFVARGDRSYVLTGGLGGFGLALAAWLCQHGARHIVLSSKRCAPNRTADSMQILGWLSQHGARHIMLSSSGT